MCVCVCVCVCVLENAILTDKIKMYPILQIIVSYAFLWALSQIRVCVRVCVCVCVCVLSCFGHVQLFAIPWTVARQAPLSVGFSRQEQWSGLSFPILGYLPDPGIETASLTSPALADGFFTAKATGETYKAILFLASHLPTSPLQTALTGFGG